MDFADGIVIVDDETPTLHPKGKRKRKENRSQARSLENRRNECVLALIILTGICAWVAFQVSSRPVVSSVCLLILIPFFIALVCALHDINKRIRIRKEKKPASSTANP